MRSIVSLFLLGFATTAQAAPESLYDCTVMRVVRGSPTIIGKMLVNPFSGRPQTMVINRERDIAICSGVLDRNPLLVCGFSEDDRPVEFVRIAKNPKAPATVVAVVKGARGTEEARGLSFGATSVGSPDLHVMLPLGNPSDVSQYQISCFRTGRESSPR